MSANSAKLEERPTAPLERSGRAFSRDALYELIWTKPMASVAEDLGISRNGLSKICDRLLIPYAGRGYWAKVQAGAAPARPPLPPAPANTHELVTVAADRPSSRRARTRLSPEVRREQIIDAAGRIIAKEGLRAATLKRIAREVGMSETQAHNYFRRGADVLVVLARRELAAMEAVRTAELERGRDDLAKVTLSAVAYLRQVAERGALIQVLLGSPEVRAALKPEHQAQTLYDRRMMSGRFSARYGVSGDMAYGATTILTAVCLRAGRLLAEGKIPLPTAERLTTAMLVEGNRAVVKRGAVRSSAA